MQFRGIGIPVWRAPSTSAVKADADEAMGMLLASKCSAMDAYWVSRGRSPHLGTVLMRCWSLSRRDVMGDVMGDVTVTQGFRNGFNGRAAAACCAVAYR